MELEQALYSRKSIRSYTGNKISEENLNRILKAAKAAPVGLGLYETVHLTVIENPDILNEINEKTKALFKNPEMVALYGAPTLVVVSVKLKGDMPDNAEYSNAAVMIENMALAATGMNIGCCHIWGAIVSIQNDPELAEKLELPEGFYPCSGIALGETTVQYEFRDIPDDKILTNYVR